MGIKDIRKMNVSLLCKWWWRLERESGIWQEIVNFKYLRNDAIVNVKHRQTDSPIWADLLKVKNIYLQGRKMKLGDGKSILAWKDVWHFDDPMDRLFSDLFKLCNQKDASSFHMITNPSFITFNRWLTPELHGVWVGILEECNTVTLTNEHDRAI